MNEGTLVNADIRRALFRKASLKKIPLNGAFELTPCCNMNCRMCYIRMSEQELEERGTLRTAEEWIALGEECVRNGMLFLLITGGEPLMRKDFRRIYEALHKMGLIITINTNGTLITEEFVEWLKTCPPSRVNVTLYGSSNETYARLCGYPRGYEAASRGVELLKDAGIYVNINGTFTPDNIEDMDEIHAFAKCRDASFKGVCYMFPPVRSAKDGVLDEAVRFSAKEAGEVRAHLDYLRYDPDVVQKMAEQIQEGNFDLADNEEECERIGEGENMSCAAGRGSFWINWKGEMVPCGMMNEPVVYPFQDGFQTAWRELVRRTEGVRMPAACGNCKLRNACMICGAVSMAEGYGDSTKKPEYMCEMTRAYLEKFKTFYKNPQ